MRTITITLALALAAASAWAGKSVPLIPANGKSVTILTGGQERTYYLLTKSAPITLEVDGPGKLSVLSRLGFAPGAEGPAQYAIKVVEGKATVKRQSTQTGPSDASYKDGRLRPGKSRRFSLDIPERGHTYTVFLEADQAEEAAVRFLFSRSKGAGKLVSLEPLAYDRIVTAVVDEKLIAYYIASGERSVQLRVIGPTRLRVSTRLNYDAAMKGDQKYAVAVSEEGKQVALKSLATSKSVGIEYHEWKDVVPGKVNAFFLDVPKGEHRYRFALAQALAHSVALKFSIPQNDLSNEEE